MDKRLLTSEPRSCWQQKPINSKAVSGSFYRNSGAAIPPSITNTGSKFFPNIRLMQPFAAFSVAGCERWFFLDVFEGGPAHIAGIKPGDMLLAVDGTEYLPPSMPPFDVGQTYGLRIADAGGENTREVVVEVPKRKGTKTRPPIVEPKSLSHAMVSPDIGLLRIMYFPGTWGCGLRRHLDAAITDLKQRGEPSHYRSAGKYRRWFGTGKACELYVPRPNPDRI